MTRPDLIRGIERIIKARETAPESVIDAVRDAVIAAYKKIYGFGKHPVVEVIDGQLRIFLSKEVVEEVENEDTEISLEDAAKYNTDAKIEDVINVPVNIDMSTFGRIAINQAKQVLVQKLNDAEKEKAYNEFKDKVGLVMSGVVRKVDDRSVLVDLGAKSDGLLRRKEMLPTDNFRPRDKVKVYVLDVEKERSRLPQIILTRTHNDFLRKLFANEVLEISDGLVDIVSVAREPGYHSKIAVKSNDPRIDPVGACVGMKGMRVQSIVKELNNEKIDIVRYNEDPRMFITNALAPAKVIAVHIIDEKAKLSEVIVPDNQLSLAIGRSGQNAKLSAKLTGWKIDIKNESERKEEIEKIDLLSTIFKEESKDEMEILNIKGIGSKTAQTLSELGITSADDIITFGPGELSDITGLALKTAQTIYKNAKEYLNNKGGSIADRLNDLNAAEAADKEPTAEEEQIEKPDDTEE